MDTVLNLRRLLIQDLIIEKQNNLPSDNETERAKFFENLKEYLLLSKLIHKMLRRFA
jgi:hypothetical protein